MYMYDQSFQSIWARWMNVCRTVAAPQTPARVLRSGRMREASSPQQPPQESDELSPRQIRCQEVKKVSEGAAQATVLPAAKPPAANRPEQSSAAAGRPESTGQRLPESSKDAARPPLQSKQAIAAAMLPPDVPFSAQPGAPPVRGPETHVTAQPAACGSSCKQSAAKLEGCVPSNRQSLLRTA